MLVGEPGRRARARARSPRSRDFMAAHPRCGVAGPRMVYPDGTLAAVAAPLPDRRRHDRPPHAATARRAAAAPLPPRRGAAERAGAGRLDARRLPAAAADDARRARRLRRGLPPLRRGHRPAVPRDAGGLGALVRPGRGRPARAPGGDRQALADAPHALALGGRRALRPQAPRAAARADEHPARSTTPSPRATAQHDYADPARVLRASRATWSSSTARGLQPGSTVLDLACGDGGHGRPLLDLRHRLPRRRREPRDGRRRAPHARRARAARHVRATRRPSRSRRPRSSGRCTTCPTGGRSSAASRATRAQVRLRLRSARPAGGRDRRRPARGRLGDGRAASVPDAAARSLAARGAGSALPSSSRCPARAC